MLPNQQNFIEVDSNFDFGLKRSTQTSNPAMVPTVVSYVESLYLNRLPEQNPYPNARESYERQLLLHTLIQFQFLKHIFPEFSKYS